MASPIGPIDPADPTGEAVELRCGLLPPSSSLLSCENGDVERARGETAMIK